MIVEKPNVVRRRTHHTTIAMATAMKMAAVSGGLLATSWVSSAVGLIGLVRADEAVGSLSRSGSVELISHVVPNRAIELSMIVEITSWAPVLARSTPGIAPHIAPPRKPANTITGTAMIDGTSNIHDHVPTQAAVMPPTRSWPWAPMLNRPARMAKARASAEPTNGTERASDPATLVGDPNMPRSSAQYASSGLLPTISINTAPTAKLSTRARAGMTTGWMSHQPLTTLTGSNRRSGWSARVLIGAPVICATT